MFTPELKHSASPADCMKLQASARYLQAKTTTAMRCAAVVLLESAAARVGSAASLAHLGPPRAAKPLQDTRIFWLCDSGSQAIPGCNFDNPLLSHFSSDPNAPGRFLPAIPVKCLDNPA